MQTEIMLDQFTTKEINQAQNSLFTVDLIKFKNRNSFFYKKNNKFINIDLKINNYGVASVAIYQFIFSGFYKMSTKNNKPIHISYKTIKDHLGSELEVSNQFISYLIKNLVKDNLILRKRIGKNYWIMQLTGKGYEYLFGSSIGNKSYLLTSLNKSKCLIYKWFEEKFRIFKKFNFNTKLKNKLELIKKLLLGLKVYKKEKEIYPKEDNQSSSYKIPWDVNIDDVGDEDLSINDIFSDEDIKDIF